MGQSFPWRGAAQSCALRQISPWLCPGVGRHRDGAGHEDPVLILRGLRAAEHPTHCPPRIGVSALGDTQTSPTGHRIPFCDISPAAGMIFLAELSGSLRVPEGGGRGGRTVGELLTVCSPPAGALLSQNMLF